MRQAVFELFFTHRSPPKSNLNFPTFYGSGKNGWFNQRKCKCADITPLLDGILQYAYPPRKFRKAPSQMVDHLA